MSQVPFYFLNAVMLYLIDNIWMILFLIKESMVIEKNAKISILEAMAHSTQHSNEARIFWIPF